MRVYHLLSTRRNVDGSFDTPSLDEVVAAPDDQSAVKKAVSFPLQSFTDTGSIAWLVDEAGKMVWSRELPQAA